MNSLCRSLTRDKNVLISFVIDADARMKSENDSDLEFTTIDNNALQCTHKLFEMANEQSKFARMSMRQ